ncbi:type II toxin-antitoxin system Phd/YefM family antitoxin [Mixta mediterraneensis]|uniref:type II toxin-antitoxin system Phd/YefM family antitoxin n=1 Tax=Mixta mediterraneensis TaxID=2758443 RepID=UPI001874DEFC|nr:type II toxin-antitoxin system prevent-host-death family antitoxin [Mixta mediterraneensis]MBE5254474.1 type II toxin-antitoxin system prevent-host-death family antitoxin [Mixta mediterraneensis]
MNNFTASEAKMQFGELLSQAMREPVSITKNGRPKAVMMSWENYSQIEALKVQHLRATLARSVEQAERGELYNTDEVFSPLTADELAKARE